MPPPASNLSDHEMHNFIRRMADGDYTMYVTSAFAPALPLAEGSTYFEFAGKTIVITPMERG